MIVGFTGTRNGMTPSQQREFSSLIRTLYGVATQFHHGGCVGSDWNAHAIVKGHIPIVVHPPIDETRMMPKHVFDQPGITTLPAREFLERNRDIVNACDLLIVTPNEAIERERGGTWATYRFARHIKRPTVMLWP